MSFEFKFKTNRRKKTKFPRYKLKNSSDTKISYPRYYKYVSGNIDKFLFSNIGKPVGEVFKKFKKYSHKIYNPIATLAKYLDPCSCQSTFFDHEGLLDFQTNGELREGIEYNIAKFNNLDIKALLNTLWVTNVPQCIGTFYTEERIERTIYIDLESTKLNKIGLRGIGYGINVNIRKKSNKIKIKWKTALSRAEGSLYVVFCYK